MSKDTKVTRDDGRKALEEYTIESRRGDDSAADRRANRADASASERGIEPAPAGRSTGLNLGEDSPFDDATAELYAPGDLNIEEFKVLECTPLVVNGEEPDCPACRPNPYAYVPDYRSMAHGDTYFDGKNCTQNVVLTFAAPPLPDPSIPGYTPGPAAPTTAEERMAIILLGGAPTVDELKSKKFQREQKEEGIRLMLEYFNKSDIVTAYKYVPQPPKTDPYNITTGAGSGALVGATIGFLAGGPIGLIVGLIGGASLGTAGDIFAPPPIAGYDIEVYEIDMLAELMEYATFEYHIPFQLKSFTRVLISIPIENLDNVPQKLATEPDEEFLTDMEVSFEGIEFVGMANRAANALNTYGGEMERWRSFEGGKLQETASKKISLLDLRLESDNIEKFLDGVKEILEDKSIGFSLNPFKPGRHPEKLIFKFKPKGKDRIELRQICFNKPGCPLIKVGPHTKFKNIWKKYVKGTAPFDRTPTLHYIGVLPEIDIALTARSPTPWLEVVTRFTYPKIEVAYGQNLNTLYNDPTILGCLSNSLLGDDAVDDFMEDVQDLILGAPDMMLQKFGKFSCYSRDDLRKELKRWDNDFSEEAVDRWDRVITEMKRKLKTEDPYLTILLEEMFPGMTNYSKMTPASKAAYKEEGGKRSAFHKPWKGGKKYFWYRLNDRLGVCGWIGLIMSAIDCVARGLGAESATKAMAEAAFKAMDNASLTRSFLGLSPEDQQKVIDSLKEDFGNMPAPWEIERFGGTYQPGSYSGPGFSFSSWEGKTELEDRSWEEQVWYDEVKKGEREDRQKARDDIMGNRDLSFTEREEKLKELRKKEKEEKKDARDERQKERADYRDEEAASRPDASPGGTGTFGMGYADGDFSFNNGRVSQGSGGSYGAALGNAQKIAFDAMRSSMLKSLSADTLMEQLNRLPGAPLVMKTLKHLPCKQTPLIFCEPRIDSFLNTLEFDLCKWDADLTLPKFSECLPIAVEGKAQALRSTTNCIWDLMVMILDALKEAFWDTVLAVFMQLMKLILEKLFSMACDLLATAGASLLDLFGGNHKFRDLLKQNMCPDATDTELYDALKGIFSAVGGPDATCLEQLTNSEMADFIDDLSVMLTQGQIIKLLQGTADEETMRLAIEVAQMSTSECIREIFSSRGPFEELFPSIGGMLPELPELDMQYRRSVDDLSLYPDCDPEVHEKIETIKCTLLGEKGLSREECREMLDDAKDQMIQDFQTLVNALDQGPFANLPPLISTPGCPPDGLMAAADPMLSGLNNAISTSMFERIENAHLRDLWGPIRKGTGHGGLLNGILSDTKGRPYKQHNWYVEHFGSPKAVDFGFFDYHCDNAIRQPQDDPSKGNKNKPIDQHGYELSAEEGGKSPSQSFGVGYAHGGYPPTVAAYLAIKYRDMDPEFKTTIVPGGFDSYEDALDRLEEVNKHNKRVRKSRKKYAKAWIKKFDLRNKRTWAEKMNRAADDIILGMESELFEGDDPFKEVLKHKVHSPEERAWRVLTGKNVSIAGQLIGTKPPKKWTKPGDKKLIKDAGVDDETTSFVEYCQRKGKKFRLLELPDTSSADMKISYDAYPDDYKMEDDTSPYSFFLEYDYNLFEELTDEELERRVEPRLMKENRYKLKITETIRSGKGETLSKSEVKKLGGEGEVPPKSILKSSTEYSYQSHDIVVDSAPPGDVKDIIDSLEIPDDVSDSYEVEAFYRYFAKILVDNSSNSSLARELTDRKPFRNYFAKDNREYIPDIEEERVEVTVDSDAAAAALLATAAVPGIGTPAAAVIAVNAAAEARRLAAGPADTDKPLSRKISLFDEISTGFLTRISTLIATGKTSKGDGGPDHPINLSNFSRAFKFGYNPDKEPKIIHLDPREYGGALGKLFPETVPPPFYVQERKHTGWMDLADILVPEVSGCDPYSKPVYSLEDLTNEVSELSDKLLPDPRLSQDPLCTSEAPYDKIMTSFDAANIDGAIRATIRIYCVDMFLRAIPVFVAFGFSEHNYGDLLLALAADRIRQGLPDDGRKRTGKTDDEYYYRFLEQCVNNTKRMIDSDLLARWADRDEDPEKEHLTKGEDIAFEALIETVRNFYNKYDGDLAALSDAAIKGNGMFAKVFSTPAGARATGVGAGSTRFNKNAAKIAKEQAFEKTIRETEGYAVVLMRRYIRKEFESIRETFSTKIPPIVNNVDHTFLLNDQWIRGGVYSGEAVDKGINEGPFDVMSNPFNPADYNIQPSATGRPWPFVLEKYIRIIEKDNGTPWEVRGRTSNLYNIVNMNDWDEYVKRKKSEGLEGKISDFWGNPPRIDPPAQDGTAEAWEAEDPEQSSGPAREEGSGNYGGETTMIENHTHEYELDEEGNGQTSLYIDAQGLEHRHEVVDFEVQRWPALPLPDEEPDIDAEPDIEDGHSHEIEKIGWRFGLRICYQLQASDNDKFDDIMATIDDETCVREKAFRVKAGGGGDRYLIPIAYAEVDIPDQNYALFDPKSYDKVDSEANPPVVVPPIFCLIQDLVKTPEYKFMFKYLFPLPRYISFMAVYSIMAFFASIGNVGYPDQGGDLWEVPGGRRHKKFRKWIRGNKTSHHSRTTAATVFNSLYDASQAIDFEVENKFGSKNQADNFRDLIRPKVNYEDGLRWWERGRRIYRNPYNVDGDECG